MTPPPPDAGTKGGSTTTLTFTVVTAAVLGLLYLIRNILLPFVLAGIVAYVCTPLIDALTLRAGGHRWLFASLVLLALTGAVGVLGFLAVPTAAHQVLALAANPDEEIGGFLRVVMGNHTFNIGGAPLNATQIAARAASGLSGLVTSGEKLLDLGLLGLGAVFGMFLTWVLLCYLLFDAPRLSRGLLWTIPPGRRLAVLRFWHRLDPILRRYFVGIALVVAYASIAAYIGLGVFLGLHHALLLALLTGLLELLPLIGPVSSAVLAGLVAVRQAASASSILAFIAYAIALRLSIDQFFGPLVLGRVAHLRPVLVMFCFLAGGLLLGISGIILAVPAALAVKVALTLRNEQCADELNAGPSASA